MLTSAVEIRNRADSLVFQSEKALSDLGDKVTEDDKKPVTEAIEKLKETLKGTDLDAIKADTEALEKAFYAISEKLYQQQAGAQGQGFDPNMGQGGQGGADANGTYYGADYEDKTNG